MTAAALVLVPRGRATGCAAVTFLLVSFTDAASFATNVNWHESKSRSHDAVLTLVHDALVTGPRGLTDDCVHSEAVVRNLPARYGLPTESPRGLLTPDLVAADDERGELLLIEVTIVPDAALPRYVGRKTSKYCGLCRHAAAHGTMRVGPPLIVALGIGGGVPSSTLWALARILGLCALESGEQAAADDLSEDEAAMLARWVTAATQIATSRADAPPQGRGRGGARTRRERRVAWRSR